MSQRWNDDIRDVKGEQEFRFPDEDGSFLVRPLSPADSSLMQESFAELSSRSRYLRFFRSPERLSTYELEYLTGPDDTDHLAWGILDRSLTVPKGVAAMRFIRLKKEPEVAESAITVVDSYQRMGLAKVAFSVLNILAHRRGVKRFRHYVLYQNSVVNKSLERLGILNQRVEDGVYIKETRVFSTSAALPDDPQLDGLRHTMEYVEQKLSADQP